MWGEHPSRNESSGFAAASADDVDSAAMAGELMGDRQAHQPSSEHQQWW